MNVWDETWEQADTGNVALEQDGPTVLVVARRAGDQHARERARLASAAPDMAHVLLGFAGERRDETGRRLPCPVCGADIGAEAHAARCALIAALRKAGVVP